MFRPEGLEDTGIPGRAAAMRNFSRIRDRLFYALFHKLSHTYAKVFPPSVRRCFEFIVFIKAVCAIVFLIYMHTIFSNSPLSCLEPVQSNWPKHDGIIRLEVVSNLSYSPQIVNLFGGNLGHDIRAGQRGSNLKEFKALQFENSTECPNVDFYRKKGRKNSISQWFDIFIDNSNSGEKVKPTEPDLVFEYALEYGFLRLSSRVRKKLGIKIITLRIDPDKDECFGTGLSRYVRREILGVEDWLRNSFKVLALEEDSKQGYLRNVKTDEHFKFISVHATRSSYIAAAFVMVLFTLSISMLLRYSHHQIFIFIIDVLQMLELNIGMVFPAAPLLTVILALVGIEAIMSEFFSDSTTAFYIIIIVWVADQYEAICCHTAITKRHWLRFFYLYHFAFYAYHYRFNGQYSGLALVASWLLIQHSMLYFFHHYELPAVLNRTAMLHGQNMVHQNGSSRQQISGPGPNGPQSNQPTQEQLAASAPRGQGSDNFNEPGAPLNPHLTNPSLMDPTSLEYIEHLLEELIPARNGIATNNNHVQILQNRSQLPVITPIGISRAQVDPSNGVEIRQTNSVNEENPNVSRVDLRNSTARNQTVPSNLALYPIQSLIVSLLVRLLNFIQTGSPRSPVRGGVSIAGTNSPGNGRVTGEISDHAELDVHMRSGTMQAEDDRLRGDLSGQPGTRTETATPGLYTVSSHLRLGTEGLLCTGRTGMVSRSQHHRRTQSANSLREITVQRSVNVSALGPADA
ncbi:membralin-like isoform X2 [Convolutriloba macropyga]|uniref:membralin-like isoform X2 n=1 Tax=Convolutriloba macropyga TaxID=536237 RepID=UPI003F51F552